MRPGEELDWAVARAPPAAAAAAGSRATSRCGSSPTARPTSPTWSGSATTPSSSDDHRSARSRPAPTTCSASTPCCRGCTRRTHEPRWDCTTAPTERSSAPTSWSRSTAPVSWSGTTCRTSLAVGPEPGRRIGLRRGRRARRPAPRRPGGAATSATSAVPTATWTGRSAAGRRRWEAVATDGRGTVDRVAELLARHLPESGQPALVHNDFKVDNCQFAAGRPRPRHLGLRLGHGDARRPAHRPRDAAELLAGRRRPPPRACPDVENVGLPSRDEVVERYAARTRQHAQPRATSRGTRRSAAGRPRSSCSSSTCGTSAARAPTTA